MKVLVDTSFLVRLRDRDSPAHATCVDALIRVRNSPDIFCICAQSFIEYWVVATRPRDVNGLGMEPTAAEADLRDFEDTFALLVEPPDMAARWRALANQYAVRGRPAHDTRLVALMQAYGITHLLTLNPLDFARYEWVVCLRPDQV